MIRLQEVLRFRTVKNGEGLTSARLLWYGLGRPVSVEKLPLGLHTHGTFMTVWAPIRSGPSFPHYVCRRARPPLRVKLAVICGARSHLRRWACLNCERLYQLIQCVRKYNRVFIVHIHVKTNFIFPTLETGRDSSDGGSVQ